MHYLYCVAGPSACGKTSTIKKMEEMFGVTRVRSYTTRKPRSDDELNDYVFVSSDEFLELCPMFGYGVYDGNEYGVPEKALDDADIYILEPSGIYKLKKEYKKKPIKVIYMKAPQELCTGRMYQRGDSTEQVRRRLATDAHKFSHMEGITDYVFHIRDRASVEENARAIFNIIMDFEVQAFNEHMKSTYPDMTIRVFKKSHQEFEGSYQFCWSDGEYTSETFETLDETTQDIRYHLNTMYLSTLAHVSAETEDGKLLKTVGMAALLAMKKFEDSGDEKFIHEFYTKHGGIAPQRFYNGEDELRMENRNWEKREAISEAFCAIEVLYRRRKGIFHIPESEKGE